MNTSYQYQSTPEKIVNNERAKLQLYLIDIENLDSGDESPILYLFGVNGEIFDRTWYEVNGSVIYNPSLDNGTFSFEKMKMSGLISFSVTQKSTGEKFYAHWDDSAGTKWEKIVKHIYPYLHQMIRDENFINESVKVVLNNQAYHAEVKANQAMRDFQDAKAKLHVAELDFVRKNNYYIRITGGSTKDLLSEDVV